MLNQSDKDYFNDILPKITEIKFSLINQQEYGYAAILRDLELKIKDELLESNK
jgi:hypothetical protein